MEVDCDSTCAHNRLPRNAVHSLVYRYNGIAANPYLRLFTRAVDSGELEFTARARLTVV